MRITELFESSSEWHFAPEMKVRKVRSQRDLDGMIKKYGWVRIMITDHGMDGWNAEEFTHHDYFKKFGHGINLNVGMDDGKYVVEFSTHTATPSKLRANPFFQKVFGSVPVIFRDHDTWEDVNEEATPDQHSKIIWKMPRHDGYKRVMIDVAKLDASWSRDKGFYITPGGGGHSIKGRYERFIEWLKQGLPVEMPEVSFNEHYQCISFGNGRHRFSVFRDMGIKYLPVCVPEEQAAFIKKNFG